MGGAVAMGYVDGTNREQRILWALEDLVGTDTYLCPVGRTPHPHNKKTAKRRNYFKKAACANCPHLDACAKGERPYRTVEYAMGGDYFCCAPDERYAARLPCSFWAAT